MQPTGILLTHLFISAFGVRKAKVAYYHILLSPRIPSSASLLKRKKIIKHLVPQQSQQQGTSNDNNRLLEMKVSVAPQHFSHLSLSSSHHNCPLLHSSHQIESGWSQAHTVCQGHCCFVLES